MIPRVPFLNLRRLYEEHSQMFQAAINGVLEQASYIGGDSVTNFETQFAHWVGSNISAVGVGNGTDALTLAATALQCEKGAEALLPAMTFAATAEAIVHAGFTPRLVDIDPKTYLIDVVALEKAITPKTRLIVPVHLYGQMGPMDDIANIAQKHLVHVMEDAAQAHGATWKGKGVGQWSDVATFSFYPGKNLGAFGDGGAIVSKNASLVEHASKLAKHGGLKKYEHTLLGYCSRLDAIQAAVLSVKLQFIDSWTNKRRQVASWYREYMAGIPELTLPFEAGEAKHVYHLYVVQTQDRDGLMNHLKTQGIETGIHYPNTISELAAFAPYKLGQFPNAQSLAKHAISLPMCPTLAEDDIKYIAKSVRSYF